MFVYAGSTPFIKQPCDIHEVFINKKLFKFLSCFDVWLGNCEVDLGVVEISDNGEFFIKSCDLE